MTETPQSESSLTAPELGIKSTKLINDFAAMRYGLLTLRPHNYIMLNDAPKNETAPMTDGR
ncbi:hypothetical protein PF011_g30471 [Phytophthora fragariae]|uniref:Uncharacterized protein n=3 Tax=Phytophthora TaxID=4783 RepID=A0A6A3GPV9_9STRA|nr:hypothetical protein PF011_g30471 [Phytophthora fragariae]